jgi:hypothetical protein
LSWPHYCEQESHQRTLHCYPLLLKFSPPLSVLYPPPPHSKQESDLRKLHEDAIKHDPFISRAMGPNPKVERMRAGSLRLGGQGGLAFCCRAPWPLDGLAPLGALCPLSS